MMSSELNSFGNVDLMELFDCGASRSLYCEAIVENILNRDDLDELTCIHMARKAIAGSKEINDLQEEFLSLCKGDESEELEAFEEYKIKLDKALAEVDQDVYGMSAAVDFLRQQLDELRDVDPDIVIAVEWLHARGKTFSSATSSEEMMYPHGVGYTKDELDEFFRRES